MIGTIIKPSIGLAPSELAEVVGELAEAGVDFIKDDELQGNGPSAPLAERVRAVMPVLHRYADRTGRMPMYAFNITDDIGRCSRPTTTSSSSAGGTCVMACINLVGLSGLEFLRRHAEVPIHGHRAMLGAISRSDQVGHRVRRVAEARAPVRRRSPAHERHQQQVLRDGRRGARLHRRGAHTAARTHAHGAGAVLRPVGRARARDLPRGRHAPTCWCSPAAASTVTRTARPPAWRACATPGRSAARGESVDDALDRSEALRRASGAVRAGACLTCASRSTATTSPAASTCCCSSHAAAGPAACSPRCPTPPTLARAAAEADVVGVAGIARSLPPGEMEAELRPALTALAALRPHIVQYKACSTADSSPDVGSLGRVLEIGREVLGPRAGAHALRPAGLRPLHRLRPALRRRGRCRPPARPPADHVDAPVHAR